MKVPHVFLFSAIKIECFRHFKWQTAKANFYFILLIQMICINPKTETQSSLQTSLTELGKKELKTKTVDLGEGTNLANACATPLASLLT